MYVSVYHYVCLVAYVRYSKGTHDGILDVHAALASLTQHKRMTLDPYITLLSVTAVLTQTGCPLWTHNGRGAKFADLVVCQNSSTRGTWGTEGALGT
jgi:hypothetical protein